MDILVNGIILDAVQFAELDLLRDGGGESPVLGGSGDGATVGSGQLLGLVEQAALRAAERAGYQAPETRPNKKARRLIRALGDIEML